MIGCARSFTYAEQVNTKETPAGTLIFDNGNLMEVQDGPTKPTTFTITASYRITLITNYHWNDGKGRAVGTIGLRDAGGRTYGPWTVTTRPGQGGVPNVYWDVHPNTVIGKGTYTVIDSHPASWSKNDDSQGSGLSRVEGTKQ